MNQAYLDGLRTYFEGEVIGERLLLEMLAVAKSPRDAWCFAHILQLETETKARLRPLMLKYGLGLAETPDLSVVPGRVASYLDQSWQAYAAGTAARLAPILEQYQAIAALGPPEDQEILQAVVAHEAALVTWARLEAQGETQASLNDIAAILHFPLTGAGPDAASIK